MTRIHWKNQANAFLVKTFLEMRSIRSLKYKCASNSTPKGHFRFGTKKWSRSQWTTFITNRIVQIQLMLISVRRASIRSMPNQRFPRPNLPSIWFRFAASLIVFEFLLLALDGDPIYVPRIPYHLLSDSHDSFDCLKSYRLTPEPDSNRIVSWIFQQPVLNIDPRCNCPNLDGQERIFHQQC